MLLPRPLGAQQSDNLKNGGGASEAGDILSAAGTLQIPYVLRNSVLICAIKFEENTAEVNECAASETGTTPPLAGPRTPPLVPINLFEAQQARYTYQKVQSSSCAGRWCVPFDRSRIPPSVRDALAPFLMSLLSLPDISPKERPCNVAHMGFKVAARQSHTWLFVDAITSVL